MNLLFGKMQLPARYDKLTKTERQRARAQYAIEQKGRCKHCGEKLADPPSQEVQSLKVDLRRFPRGFLDHPQHLHHSHKTGMTIGVVHARCNAVLWQYHGE